MSNNGTKSTAVDCPQCQQRFNVNRPNLGVMNSPTFSAAIATHEKPVRCPKCGTHYILAARFVADWGMMAISEEEASLLKGSSIIVPTLSLIN